MSRFSAELSRKAEAEVKESEQDFILIKKERKMILHNVQSK
jgi:hypothetical protein